MPQIKDWMPTDRECVTVEAEEWRFGLIFGPEYVKNLFNQGNLCEKFRHAKPGQVIAADRAWWLHNGLRFVAIGGYSSGNAGKGVTAYELVELVPGVAAPQLRRYSYSGRLVSVARRTHTLCRPVNFVSRVPTVEEQRWRLRQQWAWGGAFAHDHKTYASYCSEMLADHRPGGWCAKIAERNRTSTVVAEAARLELKACGLRAIPSTNRDRMKDLCRTDPLFVARPWAQPKPKPSAPGKVAFPLSPDDALAALLGA